MLRASFGEDSIEFHRYPFRPASVFNRPAVGRGGIQDIDLSKSPPEVRLVTGEILFISSAQLQELKNFAERLSIPVVEREDIWGDLLDPYLDTEFPISHHKNTFRRLQQHGFSRSEVRQIRAKVGRAMLLYNAFVWEWVHLSLIDVLDAVNRISFRWTFKKFYKYAMEIANRAPMRSVDTIGPAE
jgi:hypothetical protein